jgi:hypothetical protein
LVVFVPIPDNVWETFKQSWALFGVREHQRLVEMLVDDMLDKSIGVLEDSERHLVKDTPEAYAKREIGLLKEEQESNRFGQKTIDDYC